jgi:hypothetical protein
MCAQKCFGSYATPYALDLICFALCFFILCEKKEMCICVYQKVQVFAYKCHPLLKCNGAAVKLIAVSVLYYTQTYPIAVERLLSASQTELNRRRQRLHHMCHIAKDSEHASAVHASKFLHRRCGQRSMHLRRAELPPT